MAAIVFPQSSTVAPPVRRLRVRGDWSDTGPEARPHAGAEMSQGQVTQGSTPSQPFIRPLSCQINRSYSWLNRATCIALRLKYYVPFVTNFEFI